MAETVTFKIDGVKYDIPSDPQSFTAAELNAVERNTGMTVGDWGAKLSGDFSSMAWSSLAWVAVRRAGRFVAWDDFEASISIFDLVRGVEHTEEPEGKPVPNRAERRAKKQPPVATPPSLSDAV